MLLSELRSKHVNLGLRLDPQSLIITLGPYLLLLEPLEEVGFLDLDVPLQLIVLLSDASEFDGQRINLLILHLQHLTLGSVVSLIYLSQLLLSAPEAVDLGQQLIVFLGERVYLTRCRSLFALGLANLLP